MAENMFKNLLNRRSFMKTSSVAAAAGVGINKLTAEPIIDNIGSFVNTNSRPSELKITDLRVATVQRRHMLRMDTNQGISGMGEVRDGASKTYALMLKSRILGENPCSVDKVFRKIKQFGFHARQGGGVCGIEMALWDLAGKAYTVPVYQMLGGKFRDKIRVYTDTPFLKDPVEMGKKLKERINHGFTFLKMDLVPEILKGIPNTFTAPAGMLDTATVEHPFTGIQLTQKGIDLLCEYVAKVREIIGYEIPLATDHFGHMCIESGIRLAQALDKFSLAWIEDMVPWWFTDQYVRLSQSCITPVLTGEDIYLKEGFKPLFEKRGIAICQPDLATAGGILETKKIGDLAQEHGIAMAMHMAGNPVTCMANVHCAAATENFLVLEHHNIDNPWWETLVDGLPKPIIQNGYIPVPEAPGLGITYDEEAMKANLTEGGYFEPTTEWDSEKSWDRLWS